jgi:hypothetical protein
MASKDLIEIVRQKTATYMGKPYNELKAIVGTKGDFFTTNYKNKKYKFEIEADYFEENKIRVMVSAEPDSPFGSLSGFAMYFGKTIDNVVILKSDNPSVVF